MWWSARPMANWNVLRLEWQVRPKRVAGVSGGFGVPLSVLVGPDYGGASRGKCHQASHSVAGGALAAWRCTRHHLVASLGACRPPSG